MKWEWSEMIQSWNWKPVFGDESLYSALPEMANNFVPL